MSGAGRQNASGPACGVNDRLKCGASSPTPYKHTPPIIVLSLCISLPLSFPVSPPLALFLFFFLMQLDTSIPSPIPRRLHYPQTTHIPNTSLPSLQVLSCTHTTLSHIYISHIPPPPFFSLSSLCVNTQKRWLDLASAFPLRQVRA